MSDPITKIKPIAVSVVDDYNKAMRHAGTFGSQIETRLDYIIRTLVQELGAGLNWWDFENYDGNAYTLDQSLGKDRITNLDIRINGDVVVDAIKLRGDDDYMEWFEPPTRWLWEDFEQELRDGIKAIQDEIEAEKKAKAAKRAAKKAAKEKLKEAAAKKLTPEERKALGI